jgi:hypothetical protein
MGGNQLESLDSRVGWAWDEKVTTPYPAMLRDHRGQVELVIPYDSSDEVLDRRYIGSMVRWGDDPEMKRFDYELPRQFWFMDARGFVSLNGIRVRSLEPIAGRPQHLQTVSHRNPIRRFRRGAGRRLLLSQRTDDAH